MTEKKFTDLKYPFSNRESTPEYATQIWIQHFWNLNPKLALLISQISQTEHSSTNGYNHAIYIIELHKFKFNHKVPKKIEIKSSFFNIERILDLVLKWEIMSANTVWKNFFCSN